MGFVPEINYLVSCIIISSLLSVKNVLTNNQQLYMYIITANQTEVITIVHIVSQFLR